MGRTADRAARRMRKRGLAPLPDSVTFEHRDEIRAAGLPLERAESLARPRPFDTASGRGYMLPRGEPELVVEWWSLPWVAAVFELLSRTGGMDRRERGLLLRWCGEDPELLPACLNTERMAREAGLDPRELLRELWFQRTMQGEVAVFPRTSYLYRGRAFT